MRIQATRHTFSNAFRNFLFLSYPLSEKIFKNYFSLRYDTKLFPPDDGLSLEERAQKNPLANAWENSGKFEGDIFLDDDLIEEMAKTNGDQRNAYIVANTKWPSSTAVYEFGSGEFSMYKIHI
jgi:hypothetical protein